MFYKRGEASGVPDGLRSYISEQRVVPRPKKAGLRARSWFMGAAKDEMVQKARRRHQKKLEQRRAQRAAAEPAGIVDQVKDLVSVAAATVGGALSAAAATVKEVVPSAGN